MRSHSSYGTVAGFFCFVCRQEHLSEDMCSCRRINDTAKGAECMEENKRKYWKKFRRYKDAAEYYGISQSKLERLAKEAKATYKIDKIVLVNCDILEAYFETFHLEE